ncbi:hypothetical protein E2C01_076946 [Portunus trituberculatus]|uniref:Uncharacterized protein n=1 Tax=Portunus trituberculatus TaxID=210409 RepID=A0A5B7IN98_PORTR|nr:hypothetical protein [Portunus trituberculatus]
MDYRCPFPLLSTVKSVGVYSTRLQVFQPKHDKCTQSLAYKVSLPQKRSQLSMNAHPLLLQ